MDKNPKVINKKQRIIRVFLLTFALCFFILVLELIFIDILVNSKKSSLLSPIVPVPKVQEKAPFTRAKAYESEVMERDVIGFLPSWTAAQNASVNFDKLTQIIYFGLGVNDNGEIIQFNKESNPTLEWLYFTSDYFSNIRQDAKKNNVKVLIAFKMFDNENIDNLISNSTSTNFFIQNALNIVNKYDLDGINLDFEYVTDSAFPTARYLNGFLEKLSLELKKNNPEHILSIDVNATAIVTDKAYDMVKIGEVVDEIIVMGYDYRNVNSSRAGPTAPLYGEINEHSIDESISSLVGRVPMDKVILAIPFYGYEWETLNNNHKSTAVQNSAALATHKRVRELLEGRRDITTYWDDKAKSPWLTYNQSGATKQIYYEDEKSIKAKMDYVKDNDLSGVAVWAIGYEGKHHDLWDVIAVNK